jgi:hypothetical protein
VCVCVLANSGWTSYRQKIYDFTAREIKSRHPTGTGDWIGELPQPLFSSPHNHILKRLGILSCLRVHVAAGDSELPLIAYCVTEGLVPKVASRQLQAVIDEVVISATDPTKSIDVPHPVKLVTGNLDDFKAYVECTPTPSSGASTSPMNGGRREGRLRSISQGMMASAQDLKLEAENARLRLELKRLGTQLQALREAHPEQFAEDLAEGVPGEENEEEEEHD